MRKLETIIMASVISLIFVVSLAYAGEKEGRMSEMTNLSTKVSEIIGSDIVNLEGEKLGKITDLVFDRQDGRIAFAVLSHGGILGIGDELIAVPMNSLTFTADRVTLDISKDRLATAPAFDPKSWPNISDREVMENTYRFFGVSPYWEKGGMQEKMKKEAGEKKGYEHKEKSGY